MALNVLFRKSCPIGSAVETADDSGLMHRPSPPPAHGVAARGWTNSFLPIWGRWMLALFAALFIGLFAPIAHADAELTPILVPGLVCTGIAITPNGQYAYVANSGRVYVIDTASNTVMNLMDPIEIDRGYTGGIAITPNGQRAYVANKDDGSVSVIATATNTVQNAITVGNGPKGVAITPDGQYVYIANSGDNTVTVIPAVVNPVGRSTITVGSGPEGIAITPDGQYVYVTNAGGNTVSVIATTTNTVTAIAVGSNPEGIAITPDGRYAYVANNGDGTVSVIATDSNTVVSTIAGFTNPLSIGITPDGQYAYVGNDDPGFFFNGNAASVIATASNTVVNTMGLSWSVHSSGIAITPDGQYAYIANFTSVIDPGVVNVIKLGATAAPVITTASLPDATVGITYTSTIVAGSPVPTFSYTGTLPPGLSLNASTGQITGTPTVAGSYDFIIAATNSQGTVAQGYTIVVSAAALAPPTITTASLPASATTGTAYTGTVAATGSPAPTYAVTSGSLPDGLTLNADTGAITGTPTTAGTYDFTITASNSEGSASQSYTIVVSPPALAPPSITTTSLPTSATTGTAYAATVAATGNPAPTFSVTSGSLPDGLTLNADTGAITGTPTTAGTYDFTITASNSEGSASQSYTIVVSAPAAAGMDTATTLTVPSAAVTGQRVTARVAVAPAAGAVAPTGSVTVSGGGASCTDTLDSAGRGSCVLTFATAGSVTLTASYAGDANFAPSASTATIEVAAAVTARPGAHDGIYQIINADGSPGDYLSVHTNGSDVIATIYRSADPAHAASFTLTDGGTSVASLYKWGSWDLYNGTISGNSAALAGYSQYGLCLANVDINFGTVNTIRVTPTGLSGLAPPGGPASACNAASAQTLTMQQAWAAPANATVDGIYLVIDDNGGIGDYVSVHSNAAGGLIVTVYREASPASAQGFDLSDGGTHVATLSLWGSWDLYSGTLAGNAGAFTGYVQYGLCKATGAMAFSPPQTITIAPNGASEFAPAGPQPACSGAGDGAVTIVRQF